MCATDDEAVHVVAFPSGVFLKVLLLQIIHMDEYRLRILLVSAINSCRRMSCA